MAQITYIGPTRTAIAYSRTTTYQNNAATATWNPPNPVITAGYGGVVISADALAGAEEVDIYALSGGTWLPVVNVSGTAQKLTASISQLKLESGPTYAASKDATAADCGVYFDLAKT